MNNFYQVMVNPDQESIIRKNITIAINRADISNYFLRYFIIREIIFYKLQSLFYFIFIRSKILKNDLACIV